MVNHNITQADCGVYCWVCSYPFDSCSI